MNREQRLEKIEFPSAELYANPAATQWMLDSAMFDVADWIREEVGDVFAQKEGAAFINGTGASGNQPKGILDYTMTTDADAARTFGQIQYVLATGTAGSLDDPDDLISVLHALKPGYRGNATWLMKMTPRSR